MTKWGILRKFFRNDKVFCHPELDSGSRAIAHQKIKEKRSCLDFEFENKNSSEIPDQVRNDKKEIRNDKNLCRTELPPCHPELDSGSQNKWEIPDRVRNDKKGVRNDKKKGIPEQVRNDKLKFRDGKRRKFFKNFRNRKSKNSSEDFKIFCF